MLFVHENDRFTMFNKENEIGYLVYKMLDDVMYINGVVVDPIYRGKGYAKDIVNEVVNYVRDNDLKVIPRCSYVVSLFDKGGYEDIDNR